MDASSRAMPHLVHYGAADHRLMRPLFLAGGTTALLWLTQARLVDPAMLPENLARYVTNGFCVAIACLFVGAGVYVWLQTLGIALDEADRRAPVRRSGVIEGVLRQSLGRPLRTGAPASGRRCLAALDRGEFELVADQLLAAEERRNSVLLAPCQFTVWALPLLGFLGTVIGISEAVAGLRVVASDAAAAQSGLGTVLDGLSFAFDTTLVGLLCVLPAMLLLLRLRSRLDRAVTAYHAALLESRHGPER